jgi:hypothetical protein
MKMSGGLTSAAVEVLGSGQTGPGLAEMALTWY